MMECTMEKQKGTVRLAFTGTFTMEGAGEMKAAILKALGEAKTVMADVSEILDADLLCLQILCSAHRTAEAQGKSFNVTGNRSPSFLKAATEAGFVRHIGCSLDKSKSCIWVEPYLREMAA